MSDSSTYEETEDLSDYDDETYDDSDLDSLEYEGSIDFDENWDQIEDVDDFQFVDD